MYREDLVVGNQVVVVPTLSTNQAQHEQVAPAPEAAPAPETSPAPEDDGEFDDEDEDGEHVLVIGVDKHEGRKSELRRWFSSVTYVKDLRNTEFVRALQRENKKLQRVCIDHCGLTSSTFVKILLGVRASCSPGAQLNQFIRKLTRAGVLKLDCVLQFPRHDHHTHWETAMTRWEGDFGEVRHVNRYQSPLCAADSATTGSSGARDLTILTAGEEPPLCEFVVNKPSVPLLRTPVRRTDHQPDRRFTHLRRVKRFSPRSSPRARRTLLPRGSRSDVSRASAPRLSPEGMEAVESIQNLKTGADATSSYVDALE